MSNQNNGLGDRMKQYEQVSCEYLTRRVPVIIRLDGKAFHTFTRKFKRPFDDILRKSMWVTCQSICADIQGCQLAYTQSDEISLLLTDYAKITTDAWFDYKVQKIVSISAGMAVNAFNNEFASQVENLLKEKASTPEAYELDKKYYDTIQKVMRTAVFDSRAFNMPKEEVCNYFIWRQQDSSRNSISMVGRAYFSDKQLFKMNGDMVQEMLFSQKDINWNNLPTYQKRGACIVKNHYQLNNDSKTMRSRWEVDEDIPIFTQDRNYIEKHL